MCNKKSRNHAVYYSCGKTYRTHQNVTYLEKGKMQRRDTVKSGSSESLRLSDCLSLLLCKLSSGLTADYLAFLFYLRLLWSIDRSIDWLVDLLVELVVQQIHATNRTSGDWA